MWFKIAVAQSAMRIQKIQGPNPILNDLRGIMNKTEAQQHIDKHIEPGDTLVGFFYAQVPFKIWLFFLI